jgi:hypothetical protein
VFPLFVILPEAGQIKGQLAGLPNSHDLLGLPADAWIESERPQQVLRDFLHDHGIHHVDMLSTFRKNAEKQLYGVTDKHLAPEGHRLVAEEVALALDRWRDRACGSGKWSRH